LEWLLLCAHYSGIVSADAGYSTVSENLLGGRNGTEKKDAAMSFVSVALQLNDAVTSHQVVDENKFK